MDFWKLAYEQKWITAERLKLAVKTPERPFGDITPEQYEQITGVRFDGKLK